MGAVLALALLTTAWLGIHLEAELSREVASWRARLENQAASRARAVEQWLQERRSDLDVLSRDRELTGICTTGVCPKGHLLEGLETELDHWREFAGFLGVYLFSVGGDLLYSAAGGQPPCPSSFEMAEKVALGGRPAMHDVHRSRDGVPMVGFLAPVFAPAEEPSAAGVVGVVGLYLHPADTLFRVLGASPAPEPGVEVYLVGRRGGEARVLSPEGPVSSSAAPLEDAQSVEAAAGRHRAVSGWFIDRRNRDVLAAVRPVAGTAWGVVASVDRGRVFAGWRRDALQEVGLVFALLGCATMAGVAAWRSWSARRHRQLIQDLSEREEQLRALATGTVDVVFIKDLDQRYTLVNDPGSRILGVPASQALGRRARDFVAPDVAAKVEEYDGRVLREGSVFEGEECLPVGDEVRIFSSTRIPIFDSEGRVRGVAGVLRDITERKRYEEALDAEVVNRRRAEERVRRLHDATAGFTGDELFRAVVLALAADLGVRWVMINQVRDDGTAVVLAAAEGAEPAEFPPFRLAGTPCEEVVQSRVLVNHREGLRERLPPMSYLRESGADAYAGMPILTTDGEVVGVLCVFHVAPFDVGTSERDILDLYARRIAGELERTRAAETIAETRRALDTLIQNLPGAVYRSGNRSERPVDYMSPGCRMVTGYGPEEFGTGGGLSLTDLVVPEERRRVWSEIQIAVEKGAAYEVDYRIRDTAGSIRWVRDVGRRVEGGDDDPGALEGILFDHTERRSLETQLAHSQRMEALGRLAGGVAHDFNNLLTAISGYAEILCRRFEGMEGGVAPARQIVRSADRAAALTRQLLAFSRRQVADPQVIDLAEAVCAATGMLERLLGEDVELRTDADPECGWVRIDPGQLEQVLMNLAVNARDAMPRGGVLTVTTSLEHVGRLANRLEGEPPPGDYAVLEVTDTGVGMSAEVLEHLFEPFFTTKEVGKGTGLGMATVYGVVTQAGGQLSVRSEPGEGTHVRVLLPSVAAPIPKAAPAEIETPAAGRGELVLLAEDEDEVRSVAAEHLREQGYRVAEFASGREALAALDDGIGRPDVLVTDVVMPGASGVELAQRLRERWPETRVIYISGHTGQVLEELQADLGDAGFLQKPFRLAELEQAICVSLGSVSPSPRG